jgi:L-alanine-DL-glutamate epimerase-like enolase superfamily enzyme
MLQLHAELLTLNVRSRFQRKTLETSQFDTVVVAITDSITGRVGLGESAVNPRLTLKAQEVLAELQLDGEPLACDADVPLMLDRSRWLTPATRSGVVNALLDLAGQLDQQPVWRRWSATSDCPPSSVPVVSSALDELEQELTCLAPLRPTELKVLLDRSGSHPLHRRRLRMISDWFPGARLTAQMTGDWEYEQFLAAVGYLDRYGVIRVEEPLSLDAPLTEYAALARNTPFSLVAHERLLQHSIDEIAQCFHEVHLKRAYHGGILGVGSKMARARARGLRVSLGCNLESSVGITAIASLGPMADHLDLGSALMLLDDPFSGVGWDGTRPVLSNQPGFGVKMVVPAKLSDRLGQLLEHRSTVGGPGLG